MKADGVFSGGGVKAMALAGALTAAEEAGYTDWDRLAGTSAGAITALANLVGHHALARGDALSEWIESLLAAAPRPVCHLRRARRTPSCGGLRPRAPSDGRVPRRRVAVPG